MKYPVAIELGDEKTAYGVVVPDLPGCFSAGDTLDEAIAAAREAIELWIETILDDGGEVPMPGSMETHRAKAEFDGWIWALVDVDPAQLSGKAARVNITLPARLLRRIDAHAGAHHETRSGFLARAALNAMQGDHNATP